MPNHITTTLKFEDSKKFRELAVGISNTNTEIIDFDILIPMPKELNAGNFEWRTVNKFNFEHEIKETEFNNNVLSKFLNKFYNSEITRTEFINVIREEIVKDEYKSIFLKFKEIYLRDNETIFDEPKEEDYIGILNPSFIKIIGGYYNTRKYGQADWYNWSIENWGTKWNAYDIYIEDNSVTFDTAWCTPIKWLEKLAENLDFTVCFADEDLGSNFGIGYAKNGKLTITWLDEEDNYTLEEKQYLASLIKGYDYEEYFDNEDINKIITSERREELTKVVADYL